MAVFRRLALLLVLMLPVLPNVASAADPVSLPGFDDFEAGVTIDFLASGPVDAESDSTLHIIVERIELAEDETVPFADAIQSIAVLDGRLVMIDDLGLIASLKAGKQTFAPAGSFSRIRASEPTTLLRARIAPPPVDITILNDRCDPTALTRASGSTLVVRNATGTTQPFKILALDIEVDIPAGQTASVPLQAVEQTDWDVSCGENPRNNGPIDMVTLTIDNDAPAPAITQTTETAGTTVLYDGLLPVTDDGDAIFFLAQLAIAPAGSLGEQTFSGPTIIIAGDQPLQIERPGKPKAILKADGQVLFPADAVATISNPGNNATTALVIGIAPVEAEPTPTPTPAPTVAPEPTPTGASTSSTSLESFLPSPDAAQSIGLVQVQFEPVTSFDQTTFTGLDGTPFEDAWVTGLFASYLPLPGLEGVAEVQVDIEQFDSAITTATIFALLDASMSTTATVLAAPTGTSADGVAAYLMPDITPQGHGVVLVIGYYGDVIILAGVLYPPGSASTDAEATAHDLWLAIDATRP